jgi:uncharacterized protein
LTIENERSEIDRPLGRDTARPARSLQPPRASSVLLGLAALAVFGGSAAIALRERPYRAPRQAVVSAPVETASETARPAQPESLLRPANPPSSGPSIIKVDPPAGGSGTIVVRDPSAVHQSLLTAHLPDRAAVEESEYGLLPKRAADGRRPFDIYARPWSGARGARVAIVVGGLAVSQTGTQAAIEKLPAEVTLAFASGGNSIDRWMQEARRKGHEILMQVPLEPFDYPNVDPGRHTLTVDARPEENVDRLHRALARTTNYTGVMNYMGARFVADRGAMSVLMDELGERGLMYLDDGSSARSQAEELAKSFRAPFAAGDIPIDQQRDRGEILKKLDEVERTARAKGFAVGIGSAFDVTVDAVAQWAQEARKRGIEIVPISALAHDPEAG